MPRTMTSMPTLPSMKRLTRPDAPLRSHRITERDLAILRAIARYRFMSSEQVFQHLAIFDPSTSHQGVLRRLQWLYYVGALDRPVQQALICGAFAPLVYAVGREGARLLADAGRPVDAHLQWQLKNSRATAPFILHTLETTSAMLLFARDCRAGQLRLLDHFDQISLFPQDTQKLDDPFRLRATIQHADKSLALSVIPDRLISIVRPDQHRYNLALEIDRSTMSVSARRIAKSSFARKIMAYHAAWKEGRHKTQWGMQGFRVATVVPSEPRIAHILEAQRTITGNTVGALFLYTTIANLQARGPLAPIWITSERDGVSLMERT